MEEVRYMISDAAGMLHMESHVLRYWEEELELEIPRNEMGHRYYTNENIQQFEHIRQLKEQGYQLKAIKMLIHNQNPQMSEQSGQNKDSLQDYREIICEENGKVQKPETNDADKLKEEIQNAADQLVRSSKPSKEQLSANRTVQPLSSQSLDGLSPLEQFQIMMSRIVKEAIAENNQNLGREVGTQVGEKVLKEMNYLMREREEQEEERFRKLDEAIRTRQRRMSRQEKKAQKLRKKKQAKMALRTE